MGPLFDGPVPDQRKIRPDLPVTSLREFLDFLEEFEALFGPTIRPSRPIRGDRFLL